MFRKKKQSDQASTQKASTTVGTFGKYFDFVPGEKSTKFIDVIKKIKPIEVECFAGEESNLNTKNKRQKMTDILPAKDRRKKNQDVLAQAS